MLWSFSTVQNKTGASQHFSPMGEHRKGGAKVKEIAGLAYLPLFLLKSNKIEQLWVEKLEEGA